MKETERFLNGMVANIERYLPCEAGSLFFVDPESETLIFRGVSGKYAHTLFGRAVPMGTGICGWVAQHGRPLRIDDAQSDERFDPEFDRLTGFSTHAVLCVPIKIRRRTVAVLEIINPPDGTFTEMDQQLLEAQAKRLAKFLEALQLPAVFKRSS